MAKSVFSIVALAIFSVLPVLLAGCGEKDITNGENVEVSVSSFGVSLPASTVKMPLPFDLSKVDKTMKLKDALVASFQALGYQTTIEENPYAFMAMTDRVIHRVGDSRGKVTINASKETPGEVKIRKDNVRVDLIDETITSIDLDSKFVVPENLDEQNSGVLSGEMSVLQSTGPAAGTDFRAEEVNHWLGLFKFGSVSDDDKNKQFTRCASRYGATLNSEDCANGIKLLVDSSPGKLRAYYKDSATEYAFNGIVMPKLKEMYLQKFGNPDPK